MHDFLLLEGSRTVVVLLLAIEAKEMAVLLWCKKTKNAVKMKVEAGRQCC